MLQHSVQMACEASRTFTKDQMPKVRKLAYMMKGAMAKKVEALVESAGRRPVIHQYQNDATSYFGVSHKDCNQRESSIRCSPGEEIGRVPVRAVILYLLR